MAEADDSTLRLARKGEADGGLGLGLQDAMSGARRVPGAELVSQVGWQTTTPID